MRPSADAAGVWPLPSVVVVDQDADTRELYSFMLTDLAVDVAHATDGRVALAKVLAHPPNLIVMDTRIPFIDGYTLCQMLRQDPATADVPIVIATSDATADSARRALAAGADAVLTKPFLVETLIAAIRQAVEIHAGTPRRTESQRQDPPSRPPLQIVDGRPPFMKSRAHERYVTSTPPRVPPTVRCPVCDRLLRYVRSHVGGVNARHAEQWDDFECQTGCGSFDYRHRTRTLRRKPAY